MNTLFWSKIQRGDEGAFRQLYEQYADLLYGYGMKIAGDETLVTEAIQAQSETLGDCVKILIFAS